jgi:hypothetical protein
MSDLLGALESRVRSAAGYGAYFVHFLRWLFTIIMVFGGALCGLILAAPKLRQNLAFVGKLSDNLEPFKGVLGIATALSSFVRLFWTPGTPFVEDMLPGLLGTAAGALVAIDWFRSRQGAPAKPLVPEPVAMGIGIAAAVICTLHMFIGWHAPVL